jgi:beta-glucosidase/6-phospho-beta-glucosidase/beta-galactosidase
VNALLESHRQPQAPYQSFWMAGFEGADHVNGLGVPLDLVRASGHVAHIEEDYGGLGALGLHSIRESVGWRLAERHGEFDFSRTVRFAQAARRHGLQVLWSLMHYGTPSDVSLFDDRFIDRFVRFAAATARALRPLTDATPVYTPINEIGFVSWAASETNLMYPYLGEASRRAGTSRQRGWELKCRLVRAVVKAMDAIRQEDPRARFLHIEPLINVVAPMDRPELAPLAAEVSGYQWQVWDMLEGRLAPELGGSPALLDLVGVNHYHSAQWEVETEERVQWHTRDPRWAPLSRLLRDASERYGKPLVIAETSHFGAGRARWLDDIALEVEAARSQGVPVHGLCLYPIVDRPDWNDANHWHNSGLWDVTLPAVPSPASAGFTLPRRLHLSYAKTLRRWQRRLPHTHRKEVSCLT